MYNSSMHMVNITGSINAWQFKVVNLVVNLVVNATLCCARNREAEPVATIGS